MREEFDEYEFRPAVLPRDTEVTLGPLMLTGLCCGLVLLCGLCFGLGYFLGGHRSQGTSTVVQQPETGASSSSATSAPKPPASPQKIPVTKGSVDSQSDLGTSGTDTPASGETQTSSSSNGANSAQPVVKAALPTVAAASGQGQQLFGAPQAGAFMVQIAAVSHQEDADVLAGALRKRGYVVSESHDAADGLLHVRIGPFSNRNDANSMRLKLLSDGYNASVQP
jgi:cell division septation protein DedD